MIIQKERQIWKKQKRERAGCRILVLTLILSLCGCEAGPDEELMDRKTEPVEEDVMDLDLSPDISAITGLSQKDNSLDAYSAINNMLIETENPKGALAGGECYAVLGNTEAACYRGYYFENREENRHEFSFVTNQGETDSVRTDGDYQYSCVGSVLGTDHYIVYRTKADEAAENKYIYCLCEIDRELQVYKELQIDFLKRTEEESEWVKELMTDTNGYIHMITQMAENKGEYRIITGDRWRYCVISPEGEVKAEYSGQGLSSCRFVPLYDGRVALTAEKGEKNSYSLQCMDLETGKMVTLAEPEKSFSRDYYSYTLWDEYTLLYADSDGIYRSDLNGDNSELLYQWMNHGMIVSDVPAMQQVEDGINLIYKSERGFSYLCLKPTTEEVEIREITMAVLPFMKSVYKSAAVEFNRKYPTCHITIKDNYDKDALLTELIAGEGPVLIDTTLTGFENQEKLWEPLDEMFEQLGITEELITAAMEQGKINGTLYGVVTNFSLETVVTGNRELQHWDYDDFFRYVEENPNLEAVVNNIYQEDDYLRFIYRFLWHGLEDNYLLDTEGSTTNFDSDGFRSALRIAKDLTERENFVYPGETLLEGKVLCNMVSIEKPEQLALYRLNYGEDINYVGYPCKEGSGHFINSREPLAIRKTATKEEKELAYAFLSILLSRDCQLDASKQINFAFSVRKDVLEEQLDSVDENSMPYAGGLEQITLGDGVNNALDKKTMYALLEDARPEKGIPGELSDILAEEMISYIAGDISEDMLIDHLENRVGLYLEERQ